MEGGGGRRRKGRGNWDWYVKLITFKIKNLNIDFLSKCTFFIPCTHKCFCLSPDRKEKVWCLLSVKGNTGKLIQCTHIWWFCAGTPGTTGTQQTISLQIDNSLFGCFYVMRVTLLIYKPCSVALALLTCLHLYGSQDEVNPALPTLVAANQLPPPSSADNRYVQL